MKTKKQMTVFEKHECKIARDTIRNPMKGMFLGGPNLDEAVRTLKRFGYSDADIRRIK